MPKHAQQRYLKENITSNIALWRIDLPIEEISADKNLRIETIAPAKIRWSVDEWNNLQEVYTIDMGLGIHYFDLSAEKLTGPKIQFTLYWLESEEWTGKDFEIRINPTVSSSS